MKKIIGLFILVIVIAMISGCTQQAQPAAVTTPVATAIETAAPTDLPTAEATPELTVEPVPVATPEETTEIATTAATVISTPKPDMTPSTKITTIYIRNGSFVPNELVILPGTGLTWINDDATVQAIKLTSNQKVMFNSGDFVKGAQWDYTFGANEGTFEIINTYSNATSVIIVKKGALLVGN
jgi:plastocyanin